MFVEIRDQKQVRNDKTFTLFGSHHLISFPFFDFDTKILRQSERDPIRELVDLREAKDMGVAQNLNSQNSGGFNIARDVIETTLLNARQYMENEVLGGKMSQDTVKLCKNEHADCAIWAAAGECEVNPNCKFPIS